MTTPPKSTKSTGPRRGSRQTSVGDLYKPTLGALVNQLMKDAGQTTEDLAIALNTRVAKYAAQEDADLDELQRLTNQAGNLPRVIGQGNSPLTMRFLLIVIEALGWDEMSLIVQVRDRRGRVVTSGVDLDFHEARVGMLSVDVTGASPVKPKPASTPLRSRPAGLPDVEGHDSLLARLRRAQVDALSQMPTIINEDDDEPTA